MTSISRGSGHHHGPVAVVTLTRSAPGRSRVMHAATVGPPPIGFAGPLEGIILRGDRAIAPLQYICVVRFLRFVCPIRFSKRERECGALIWSQP